MTADVIAFPRERWQEAKPRRLRLSKAYRAVRRGSGFACEAPGCKRKAQRQLIDSGRYLCDQHSEWES